MKTNNENNNYSDLKPLISKLKKEDINYASIVKAIQIMYWIFIPLFMIITILEYTETKSINEVISGSCFILSFLIIALFFRKYYKEYKFVDYSLPTIKMLKKAANSYQPFRKNSVWFLPGLLLMDIGLTFDWVGEGTSLIKVQVFFWGLMVIAVIIGLIVWFVKYRPIRDEALQMIKEIEGE